MSGASGGRGQRAPGPAGPQAPPDDKGTEGDLDQLRERIEALDRRVLELVAERVALARRIGAAKARESAATLDPSREAAVIRNAVSAARERGLPEEPVRELFWTLVGLCRAAQLEER